MTKKPLIKVMRIRHYEGNPLKGVDQNIPSFMEFEKWRIQRETLVLKFDKYFNSMAIDEIKDLRKKACQFYKIR